MNSHTYRVNLLWTAAEGAGTKDYRSYSRDHTIVADGKPPLAASSDATFRGDASRYNPEEMLVAALSSCHMLWYLHLCATHGVVVTEYSDWAAGEMKLNADGSGQFLRVTLHPRVTISETSDRAAANGLHEQAHHMCFIARSVNFPVLVEPHG